MYQPKIDLFRKTDKYRPTIEPSDDYSCPWNGQNKW